MNHIFLLRVPAADVPTTDVVDRQPRLEGIRRPHGHKAHWQQSRCHLFLRQAVLVVRKLMQIEALWIRARHAFQKRVAVLCRPEARLDLPPLPRLPIDLLDTSQRIFRPLERHVRRTRRTVLLRRMRRHVLVRAVDGYLHQLAKLPEIRQLLEHILVTYIHRQTDCVDQVWLHHPDIGQVGLVRCIVWLLALARRRRPRVRSWPGNRPLVSFL
mmetsp:Transcript_738/g.1891  ORF Transcript_738/g.1891 Transcript_738/m.1891 type:complete len:213 (-) Transcript_738:231-869(-)